jgi:hypothetical protein
MPTVPCVIHKQEQLDGNVWQEGGREGREGDARTQARHAEERRLGKTVTSRKQAIAIGLSEARAAGGKVPAKKTTAKKRTAKKSH